MRVWIEIKIAMNKLHVHIVTLHVRVWIEMDINDIMTYLVDCHPPREGVD